MQVLIIVSSVLAAASAGLYAPLGYASSHGLYPQHLPVIVNGVPVDTPEVQHARAAHAQAHAVARANGGHGGYDGYNGEGSYGGGSYGGGYNGYAGYAQHVPIIANGVPIDTPEVQHAKLEHAQAHAVARANQGYGGYAGGYNGLGGYGLHGPIIAGGVPLDTPEVQHAKAAHFAAHAEANARTSGLGHGLSW